MVAQPVVPAAWEAKVGELLELRRRRLQWAEIVPLHSSLGNKSKTPSQKKKMETINFITIIWELSDKSIFKIPIEHWSKNMMEWLRKQEILMTKKH